MSNLKMCKRFYRKNVMKIIETENSVFQVNRNIFCRYRDMCIAEIAAADLLPESTGERFFIIAAVEHWR